MINEPIYPKNTEERLIRYRTAFLEKVKKWKWDNVEECTYKKRGRKAKVTERIESQPRTPGERQALKQSKYKWL
jgi:hypothetical protein